MNSRGLFMLLAFAALLAAVLPAGANVLYKSVDERGTITFSDQPPPAGSRLLAEQPIPSPAPGYAQEYGGPGPGASLSEAFEMIDYDRALREANDRVDLAEHALAQARAGHGTTTRPGLNAVGGLPAAEADRIEFHKRDLRVARIALAELLRSRQLASGRTPR